MICRVIGLLFLLPLVAIAGSPLASHPSPYLQSHADDAIHWRLPGPEAVNEAHRRDLPLLVSSGYLACYWCYRLKSESFTAPELATLVNASFIPVLLDREVHAEDDRRLQDHMQAMLGFSGWPVIMVLTPDHTPVKAWPYTATNTLSDDLETIANAWSQDAESVATLAREFQQGASTVESADKPDAGTADLGALLSAFLEQTGNASDSQYGGFGREAKYPYVPQLQVLLDLNQLNPSETMADFLRFTLDKMLGGE